MSSPQKILIATAKCVILARDKGICVLKREFNTYKKEFIPEVQKAVRKVVKDRSIEVYSQQKWNVDQNLTRYIKNLPLHPMAFHNQSVWIEKTEKEHYKIHIKTKHEEGEAICYLTVPFKYRSLIDKAVRKDNPVLGQVELIEDNKYARFNVHITLRLPKPKLYEPEGWVGVDVGWNCLAVSALVTKDGISNVSFHGKDFKTRILQLKYLLKQYQRSNRSWKKWNQRLSYTTKYAVGVVASQIVKKAQRHKAGVTFENLTFPSHTKRFLIPRYKLKCAIQTLCERKGIPFKLVNPRNTSITCNRCGYISKASRNGKAFNCEKCGYQANADYNAAVNIARKGDIALGYRPTVKADLAIC